MIKKFSVIWIIALMLFLVILPFVVRQSLGSNKTGERKVKVEVSVSPASYPEENAKQNDIRKLLTVSGSPERAVQMMNRLIERQRKLRPEIPPEFWLQLAAEINEEDLIEMMVPIYDKYFTHEEIKEIIRFYESPAGKKYLEVMPKISREAGTAGKKWGEEIIRKINERMKEKGYV